MNIAMHVPTRAFSLGIVTLLALAAANVSVASDAAADTTPAAIAEQAPVEQLQELGEIWVRGKRLSGAIADAEDEFFRLYNKLNTDHDYDITCGYLQLERASMIMTRTCVPSFLAYTYPNIVTHTYSSYGGLCYDSALSVVRDLNGTQDYYSGGGCSAPHRSYTYSTYNYVRPQPVKVSALIPDSRRQEYYRNMMKVIYSDQRLTDQAAGLARLYAEMQAVQNRYYAAKAEADARRNAAREASRQARLDAGYAPINPNPRFQ